ncbi:MAG: response regulator, partial [Synergistaceae bacterium]|nr:response regulator [Synergistaceae bacterium]
MKRCLGFFRFLGVARFREYFNETLDFRVRLYNILAAGGMIVCVFMGLKATFVPGAEIDTLVNGIGGLLALGLLRYSYRSGRYRFCYAVSIALFFLILFPVMFFLNDGYHGGMPIFFVFAILFTVFMLDGRELFVITAAETLVYVSICLVAWLHPEYTIPFRSEWMRMQDIVFSFVCSSGILGTAMFLHFKLYKNQQRRLEEASNAKTAFLASMSHEIRTPLNVILGMNEMIRTTVSGPVLDWSGEIQLAGESLKELINELLDISKIEAGRQKIVALEYRVSELIHDLTIIGEQETRKRGLEFMVRAEPDVPSKLNGDFPRVRQIVTNFLVNAAKYTEHGAVTLTVGVDETKTDETGNVILRLSVSDTGAGIRPEDIDSLFEKFSRGSADSEKSRRQTEGVGLGLAIAKELSDLMDGDIKVESAFGEGSTFMLLVPQKLVDAAPMGNWRAGFSVSAEELLPLFTAPGGRILAVDDNPGNLRVIEDFLGRTQLRVDTAPDGRECIKVVKKALEKKAPYHLIVMDYMMPDMDGIKTLKKLRGDIPDFDIPVVALTADAIAGEREKFLRAGFAAYLSKPVTRSDLEKVIFDLLPKDIAILYVEARKPSNIPQAKGEAKEQKEWENRLSKYGVSLSEGLKYTNGDMTLFRTQASIFIENFASAWATIESKRDEGDWAGMARLVHSLKSGAGYAGAVNLRETALKIERACRAEDSDYARLALPLLL